MSSWRSLMRGKRMLMLNGVFIAAGYCQAGLSFIISIWLANYLGASMYGVFAYGLVHANIVAVLAGFGQEQSLVRDLVQSRNPARVMTVSATLRLVLFTLLVAGYGIHWLQAVGEEQEMANVMLLCVLSSASLCLSPRAWMDKDLRMWLQAVYTVLERAVFLVLLALVFLGFGITKGPLVAACCLLVSRAMLIGLEWSTAFYSFRPDFSQFMEALRAMVQNNLPIAISVIANLVITQYATLILEHKMDIANVGYYVLASQFVMLIALLQNQMMRLQRPKISRIVQDIGEQKLLMREWMKQAGVSIAGTLLILIPMAAAVPLFIKYAMKPEYSVIITLFFILLIRQSFYGLAMVTNLFIIGLHLNWQYLMVTVSAGVLSILLTPFLIDRFGLIGAPVSLVIAHGISVVVQFMLLFIKSFHLEQREPEKS